MSNIKYKSELVTKYLSAYNTRSDDRTVDDFCDTTKCEATSRRLAKIDWQYA